MVYQVALLALAAAASPAMGFLAPKPSASTAKPLFMSADEFLVGVVGDLHMDPRKMEDYQVGREQFLPILQDAKAKHGNVALVSLGDLGESKSVKPDTSELFAGTTECHELAAEFLGSFGVPYELVGGNHDLEGIDEFATDKANLDMFLKVHNKPSPNFSRVVAEKTLLVGLTSTIFRGAKYTSHEVTIDDAQMAWFEETIKAHSAADGWKIFIFTHAPPNGSGLRVLQENHVVNGCCWLNHSDATKCRKFIEIVRENRSIKAWFSGHFHLGQDYQDSITFPSIDPTLGPYPNRGACTFAQTSVMRGGTSRDGRQQSRLIRGNKEGFEICTVDHQKDGAIRVDATVTYSDCNHEVGVYGHADEARSGDEFFKVYAPNAGDDLHPPDAGMIQYEGSMILEEDITKETVKWWYLASGQVLGLLNGMLIEYDSSTMAPLGLVVGADELVGKRIAVIESVNDAECIISDEIGMEGADCADDVAEPQEQAVILIDNVDGSVVVVQPNEDGSYWRKIVRNKMIRMKEVRREKSAKAYAALLLDKEASVVSSWGPYISTKGTAKNTGVSGLTMPSKK
jgi:3',5'-cyclic AMP phosphodiesterase CpdA